ncbi:MAG: hypothetical protein HEQ32_04425 [Vampirovibrio sp.]|jgi:hypothetical protein
MSPMNVRPWIESTYGVKLESYQTKEKKTPEVFEQELSQYFTEDAFF